MLELKCDRCGRVIHESDTHEWDCCGECVKCKRFCCDNCDGGGYLFHCKDCAQPMKQKTVTNTNEKEEGAIMNAKEQNRWDERSEESIDQMLVDIACKCSSLLSAIQCLNYYKLNNIDPTAAKEYRTNALVYMDELYDVMSRDCQTKKTPTPFHTEHYTLNRTKDGWLADPQGNAHEWFDFPTITFSEDGECHVELDAESIDMSGELDTYKEFLTMLHDELTQLKQHINQ